MSQPTSAPYSHKNYAKRKVMDLVAMRDHSELELRQKLKEYFRRNIQYRKKLAQKANRDFTDDSEANRQEIAEAIEGAIQFARDQKWLGDENVLAGRMANSLHRKNKGIGYINNKLKQKGLPTVTTDRDLELEKALTLVKNKFSGFSALSYDEKRKEQARVARFLAARGFDPDTVRKVIYEEL
jgi:regulatory protein